MELKLQNLLFSLPTRTAWIIVGSCAAFWLICLTGILTPPVSAPPRLTLVWFYAMLMLVLISGLAVIGAGAVLVLKRGGLTLPASPVPASAPSVGAAAGVSVPAAGQASNRERPAAAPAETDDPGEDQLAGLGRMMDGPNLPGGQELPVTAAEPAAPSVPTASPPPPSSRPGPARKAAKRKSRKRRR